MNKYVHLPKMVPLNEGVRDVLGVWGGWGGKKDMESDEKAPPAWGILTNIEVPPLTPHCQPVHGRV